MSEVKELKFDELPNRLQGNVEEMIQDDINVDSEFMFEEKLGEFKNTVEKKFNSAFDLDKLVYDFSYRCPYIKYPTSAFEYFLANALDEKLTEKQRDYFMGVQFFTNYVGVGQFEFPVYEVGFTEDNAFRVEIAADCPDRTEQAIKNKASKIFYDFMEEFKKLFYDLREYSLDGASDIYNRYEDSIYKVKDGEIIEIKTPDGDIVYENNDLGIA